VRITHLPTGVFVACQTDERGVLVLSRFTGAAEEIDGPLLVNPFNVDGFAAGIRAALAMPMPARRRRMHAMRREISQRALSRTLPPARRSILADVVTKRTLDRVVEWAEQRDPALILDWVDSVVQEYPQESRLYNLMPSTVSAALDVLSEEMRLPVEMRLGMTDLQQRIDVHIGAFCSKRQEQDLRAIDPVDDK